MQTAGKPNAVAVIYFYIHAFTKCFYPKWLAEELFGCDSVISKRISENVRVNYLFFPDFIK